MAVAWSKSGKKILWDVLYVFENLVSEIDHRINLSFRTTTRVPTCRMLSHDSPAFDVGLYNLIRSLNAASFDNR